MVFYGGIYGRTNKKTPVLTKKDERDIEQEFAKQRKRIESGEAFTTGEAPRLSPETIDSIMAAMKLGFITAILKNKETYTPKKYKKE